MQHEIKRITDFVLENICGSGCPCHQGHDRTHLNVVCKPLLKGEDPPAELPPARYINIRGREEHEAILKDAKLCQELGIDQLYETVVYLKRWGRWLSS